VGGSVLNLGDWNFAVWIILALSLVVFAVLAVMVRSLLKAAISLALTSAVLTMIMFVMKSPLAAVFELSVCAGLITVVFISAISMTRTRTEEETKAKKRERIKRFAYLPVILVVAFTALLWFAWTRMDFNMFIKTTKTVSSVREVLWNSRQLDILGQIIIILAGVFGIVVLFKERDAK
jgi:NADH-quinone oxidoreductase subunit J